MKRLLSRNLDSDFQTSVQVRLTKSSTASLLAFPWKKPIKRGECSLTTSAHADAFPFRRSSRTSGRMEEFWSVRICMLGPPWLEFPHCFSCPSSGVLVEVPSVWRRRQAEVVWADCSDWIQVASWPKPHEWACVAALEGRFPSWEALNP